MMSLIGRATTPRKEHKPLPKRATNARPSTVSPKAAVAIEEAYKRGMRGGRTA